MSNKEILIDSEGLIQRLLLYCYKKKHKNKIIDDYLSLIKLPKILVYFDKNFKFKKKLNLNQKELKTIYNKVLNILKKKKKLILIEKNGNMEITSKKINKICKI